VFCCGIILYLSVMLWQSYDNENCVLSVSTKQQEVVQTCGFIHLLNRTTLGYMIPTLWFDSLHKILIKSVLHTVRGGGSNR